MSTSIAKFDSTLAFDKFLDRTIWDPNGNPNNNLTKEIEEATFSHENLKSILKTMEKYAWGKGIVNTTNQLELDRAKMLVNSTAKYDPSLAEKILAYLQEKFELFEEIRQMDPLLNIDNMAMKKKIALSEYLSPNLCSACRINDYFCHTLLQAVL